MRLGLGIAAVGLAGAAAACAVVLLGPRPGGPVAGSRLRILFTGETLGELEPCNCSGKMAGGLPARGGYVASVPEADLRLDIGCVGRGARDFERLRTDAALRAMDRLGYDAINLGRTEVWLGRDALADRLGGGVPFVSANVVDAATGRPVAPAVRRFERAGLAVAVTGVVGEEAGRRAGPGLAVRPPREAVARLVPALAERPGVVVLLADLALPAVRGLAGEFPELGVILFRGAGDSHAPEVVNRTVVASIYGEARYVGDLTVRWRSPLEPTAAGEAVLLDDRFPPDPAVREAAIAWYKAQVEGRTFDLAQDAPGWDRIRWRAPEPDNRYIDPAACRKCHPREYAIWSRNRHARAMASLREVGYDWSPECVVCHTTGYGAADGYVSAEATPALGRIGCDECHGRGALYLKEDHRGISRFRGEATCRKCHAPKRHPDFHFETHWARITHAEEP
jgi:hypothetical protein